MKAFTWILTMTCSLVAIPLATAHPVAQGALDLEIFAERIHVQARVSAEEVFVANAFGDSGGPKSKTAAEVWQRHGDYLLRHLKVFADERALTGQVGSFA